MPKSADQIKADAVAFAAKANLANRAWPQEAHVAFLAKSIANEFGIAKPEDRLALIALLSIHGLGGNASQFRQWVFPEPEKAKATSAAANRYANIE